MRPSRCLLALLTGLAMALPGSLWAGTVRLLSADDRGVTLRLDLPARRLDPGAADRSQLVVPGFQVIDEPGRPGMPFVTALVALPPGAGATATLVSSGPEAVQSGVSLQIAGKPVVRPDERLGSVPTREPVPAILDGAWPTNPIEVGAPFVWRRQRLVSVSFRPFRYDESSHRLWTLDNMTVRVQFTGVTGPVTGVPREDAHWEPVMRQAVINYTQGRSWRETPMRGARSPGLFGQTPGVTGGSVLEDDFPEVRVRIDTTGVYSIPFETVAAAGYPGSVPIERVSVHRHEFKEGAVPPYETIELGIEVDDNDNDTYFGPGDAIVLYVQNWAERSRATTPQRQWGDAEIVYVTEAAGLGRRVPSKSGWRNATGLLPPDSYPWSQHWEEDHYYNRFPADTSTDQLHWTQSLPYHSRPAWGRIPANHIDLTRPVDIHLNLAGRVSANHYDFAEVRNGAGQAFKIMDSTLVWFGTGELNRSVTLPPGALSEGDVNGLYAWGKSDFIAPCPCDVNHPTCTNCVDRVGLNYYDVTYWRSYRALEYYLPFNSGDQQGEFQIHATGFFNTAIRLYDVTDSTNVMRVDLTGHIQPDGSEFAFDFQDSTAAGQRRRYVACVFPKSLADDAVTPVTREHLGTRGAGDYLLIVPEAFRSAVGPLVALRQSQNIDVVVAPFESVCDEFNGGRKSVYAIKRFVRYAYENWSAKFVLLVGDGNEDPMNRLGDSSHDWIPVKKILGPVPGDFGLEVVVSDPWYGCMSSCVLGGFIPAIPDVAVGRLPVQTLQQAQDVVAKLVAYEHPSGDQAWRNQILLSADDDHSGIGLAAGGQGGGSSVTVCRVDEERVFTQLSDAVAAVVRDSAGFKRTRIDDFYLGDLLGDAACLDPSTDPSCRCRDLGAVRSFTRGGPTIQLLSRLSAGCLWWNFQGHANEFVLTHEDLYKNEDGLDDSHSLFNDGKPFLFSAFACHANAFARAGDLDAGGAALGEELVNSFRPGAGAIASYASTGFEILPFSSNSHINVALANALFFDPPIDDYFDGNGARVLTGEAVVLALARYVPGVVVGSERGVGLTYNLLGDPATRLSLGSPQTIVTANGDTVISDRPLALAPPRDTLHMEADIVSNARIDSLWVLENGTTRLPESSYTVTPAFPDTGVGNQGGRRYHISYTTPVRAGLLRETIHSQDRYGLVTDFNLVLQFSSNLEVAGNRLLDNDPVLPAAMLALRVVVPTPVADPLNQFVLKVDGVIQPFAATSLESTGREWRLDWTHEPYSLGTHTVEFTALGNLAQTHTFRVVEDTGVAGRLLTEALAFPNPFDEEVGTSFSFYLLSDAPSAVLLKLFTVTGHKIYQREEHNLAPGYHQWTWNGKDAEGEFLANGVYLYTLTCSSGSRTDALDGRLVKLRRPHSGDTAN